MPNVTLCQCYYHRSSEDGRTGGTGLIQLLIHKSLEINSGLGLVPDTIIEITNELGGITYNKDVHGTTACGLYIIWSSPLGHIQDRATLWQLSHSPFILNYVDIFLETNSDPSFLVASSYRERIASKNKCNGLDAGATLQTWRKQQLPSSFFSY